MIYEILQIGAENAISRRALCSMLDMTDRDLRRQVSVERRAGRPILTDTETNGYYLPSNPKDVERFVRSMRNRAKQTTLIADSVEKSIEDGR